MNPHPDAPAFPQSPDCGAMLPDFPGLTARAYAAIWLRVAQSGEPWLDAMIREAQRDEDARAALPASIAEESRAPLEPEQIITRTVNGVKSIETTGGPSVKHSVALAYQVADAMRDARGTEAPERAAAAAELAAQLRAALPWLDAFAADCEEKLKVSGYNDASARQLRQIASDARAALAAWEGGVK